MTERFCAKCGKPMHRTPNASGDENTTVWVCDGDPAGANQHIDLDGRSTN